jgi:hypothetical protein
MKTLAKANGGIARRGGAGWREMRRCGCSGVKNGGVD